MVTREGTEIFTYLNSYPAAAQELEKVEARRSQRGVDADMDREAERIRVERDYWMSVHVQDGLWLDVLLVDEQGPVLRLLASILRMVL